MKKFLLTLFMMIAMVFPAFANEEDWNDGESGIYTMKTNMSYDDVWSERMEAGTLVYSNRTGKDMKDTWIRLTNGGKIYANADGSLSFITIHKSNKTAETLTKENKITYVAKEDEKPVQALGNFANIVIQNIDVGRIRATFQWRINKLRTDSGIKGLNQTEYLTNTSHIRAEECTVLFAHRVVDYGENILTAVNKAPSLRKYVEIWESSDNKMVFVWKKPENTEELIAIECFNLWLNSPGHRENMLYGPYTSQGFDIVFRPNVSEHGQCVNFIQYYATNLFQ